MAAPCSGKEMAGLKKKMKNDETKSAYERILAWRTDRIKYWGTYNYS